MQLNEIHDHSEHASVSLKVILLVFAIVLVGALGYLVWDYRSTPDSTEDISTTPGTKTETTATKDEAACAEPTASLKLYESTNLGYCFTYPKAWILTDGKGAEGDKRTWYASLTDKVVPNSDYPGQVSVNSYAKLTDLDWKKTGGTDLKDFLTKSAALAEPTYTDIAATKIGGKEGFTAKAGPESLASATYYFVTMTDGTILEIAVFYDNAETKALIESFKITK